MTVLICFKKRRMNWHYFKNPSLESRFSTTNKGFTWSHAVMIFLHSKGLIQDVVLFSPLKIPLHAMHTMKLKAARHIKITEVTHTLMLSRNQPTTITKILKRTNASPIFEKIYPNLHITLIFSTNLHLKSAYYSSWNMIYITDWLWFKSCFVIFVHKLFLLVIKDLT